MAAPLIAKPFAAILQLLLKIFKAILRMVLNVKLRDARPIEVGSVSIYRPHGALVGFAVFLACLFTGLSAYCIKALLEESVTMPMGLLLMTVIFAGISAFTWFGVIRLIGYELTLDDDTITIATWLGGTKWFHFDDVDRITFNEVLDEFTVHASDGRRIYVPIGVVGIGAFVDHMEANFYEEVWVGALKGFARVRSGRIL